MARKVVEKRKVRSDLSQVAVRREFSAISMVAGVLVAYAAFAVLLAGAVAILRGNGSQFDLSENWGDLSSRGGLLLGGLLLAAYLLGGYVAGRMAWRRGATHGVLVFLGSVLVIGVVATLLRAFTQPDDVEGIVAALQRFGVPTTAEEWGNVGAVVWVASLAGMLLGSVVGGLLGARWFTKVSRRAIAAELDLRDREAAAAAGNGERETEIASADRSGAGTAAAGPPAVGRETDVDALTKDELYQRAQEHDIHGRSNMTKDELAAALKEQGALKQ